VTLKPVGNEQSSRIPETRLPDTTSAPVERAAFDRTDARPVTEKTPKRQANVPTIMVPPPAFAEPRTSAPPVTPPAFAEPRTQTTPVTPPAVAERVPERSTNIPTPPVPPPAFAESRIPSALVPPPAVAERVPERPTNIPTIPVASPVAAEPRISAAPVPPPAAVEPRIPAAPVPPAVTRKADGAAVVPMEFPGNRLTKGAEIQTASPAQTIASRPFRPEAEPAAPGVAIRPTEPQIPVAPPERATAGEPAPMAGVIRPASPAPHPPQMPAPTRIELPRAEFVPLTSAPPVPAAPGAVAGGLPAPAMVLPQRFEPVAPLVAANAPAMTPGRLETWEPMRPSTVEAKPEPVAIPLTVALEQALRLQPSPNAGDVAVIPKHNVTPVAPSPAIPLPVRTEKDVQEEAGRLNRREAYREAQLQESLRLARQAAFLWMPQDRPVRPYPPVAGMGAGVPPANNTERTPTDKRSLAPHMVMTAPIRDQATFAPSQGLRIERVEIIEETGRESIARGMAIGDNMAAKPVTGRETEPLERQRPAAENATVPAVFLTDPAPQPQRIPEFLATQLRSRYVRVPTVNVLDLVL
jgi:hypothetical protein